MNIVEPVNDGLNQSKKSFTSSLQFMKRKKFWVAVGLIHLFVIIPAVVYLVWKKPQSDDAALAKYRDSLPRLKKELEKDPENYELRNEYAYSLYVTRNDDEAIDEYSKLVAKNANDPVPSNNLGNLLRKRGSYDDAINSYKRSIAANPTQINAYVNLAHLYIYDQRQPELGYEVFNQVIEMNPDNVDLKVMLAKTYQQQKDNEKAEEVFNDILQSDPNNVAAQNGLNVLGASTEVQ